MSGGGVGLVVISGRGLAHLVSEHGYEGCCVGKVAGLRDFGGTGGFRAGARGPERSAVPGFVAGDHVLIYGVLAAAPRPVVGHVRVKYWHGFRHSVWTSAD